MSSRISMIAAAAILCCVSPTLASAQQHGPGKHHQQCAEACNRCQRICDECAIHCAHMVAEGKKEHLETLRSCQDCAVLCATASQIVSRGGPMSDLICKSCADACKRCGDACAKHKDDKLMQACAEECYKCEKECRAMLEHAGK